MNFTSRISSASFDELVRPKLRLFLSVDIVGSTELKYQQAGGQGPEWMFPLLNFFVFFPQFLTAAVDAVASGKSPRKGAKPGLGAPRFPMLWKALGDELIFVVELRQRHEAARYVCAFRDALQQAAINWPASASHRQLQFKGTAWLAGFPLGNTEVPMEERSSSTSPPPDFVGPQIDAGFRLKDHASPRKLVLSADLAYLLVCAGRHQLELFFDGDQPLRGVMRGKPYPLIWIDCEVRDDHGALSLNQLKDKLLGRKPAKKKLLHDYLDAWLNGSGNEVPKPFIDGDPFSDLSRPDGYASRLQAWMARLRATFLVDDSVLQENTAGAASTIPSEIARLLK